MSDMPHVNEPADEQSAAKQPPLPKIETGPLSSAEMQVPEPPRYSAEPTAPNPDDGFDDWLASLAAAEEEASSFTPPAETGPMPVMDLEAAPLGETGAQSVPNSAQVSQEPVIADPPEPEEALLDWLQDPAEDMPFEDVAPAASDETLVEVTEQIEAAYQSAEEPDPVTEADFEPVAVDQLVAADALPAAPEPDLADNDIDPATLVATATAAAASMHQVSPPPPDEEEDMAVDEAAALAAADAQGEEPSWLQEVALGGEVPVTPASAEEPAGPVIPIPPPVEKPVVAPPPLVETPPQAVVESQPVEPGGQFAVGRCPRCGSPELGRGTMVSYGERFRPAYYKPAGLSFRRLHNFLRPFRRLVEVEGQVCRECGMMILQVDTEKLEKLEKKSGDRK